MDAINRQDQTYLNGLLTADAVWLDEDGHMFPARTWLMRLITGTPAKKFAIVATPAARVGRDHPRTSAWLALTTPLMSR